MDSTPEGKKWDVFICFRGTDVRQDFLRDLYTELTEGNYKIDINPFLDDLLRTGKEIENNLLEQIDDSLVSLVIFSQHFPDSSFCLNEIVRIRNCREKSNQIVIPVFYKVKTDDVQELELELKPDSDRSSPVSSFRKTFLELANCNEEKKKEWLEALVEISNIKGFDSHNFETEFRLIKAIVKDVWRHLCEMPITNSDNDGLVGIDSQFEIVKSLLVNEPDIKENWGIGIWGLPGVGKTALADKVYNDIKDDFDSYCFIENFKEEKKYEPSLSVIRDRIIKKLLGMEEGSKIGSPYQISPAIKRRLRANKVLIVIDDVEDSNDLKELAGEYGLYKKGSRMIVTSRDQEVLKNVCSQKNIYEVKELLDHDALILFSLHAFKQNQPIDGFLSLSKMVISYCQGLPLALRVLGSNLYGKDSTKKWDNELERLAAIPNKKIVSVLKTSCDGLEPDQLNIFLDIACFFRGENKDRVERILEGCGFYPESGIERLINKSLIRISSANKVEMHDLIQQMGQDFVFEQCQQPGGRSRLWKFDDVCDVLTKDTVAEKVEGVLIAPFVWKKMAPVPVVPTETLKLSPTTFRKMSNLRFFKFCNHMVANKVSFSEGLEFLPEKLRYLMWLDYPLTNLPLDPKNLVEICLRYSRLEKLWDENKEPLQNLIHMDVSYSKDLVSIPDLGNFPNLEVLNLKGCRSLVNVLLTPKPSSKLKQLICQSCDKLKVPNNLCALLSLEELDLGGNSMESLPASIHHLSKLKILNLLECIRLECLPELPKSLKYLNVGGCISLKSASSSFLSSSEGEGEYCNLNFASCIRLDMDVRRKFVKDVFEMHLIKQGVNLCIVGNEVPPSMKYKERASSLSFSLDEHKLTGLSFSAVLTDDFCVGNYTYIGCKADFTDEFGKNFTFNFDWDERNQSVSGGSSHMLSWYKPFNEEHRFIKASFQFYVAEMETEERVDEAWPIVACGVHPV